MALAQIERDGQPMKNIGNACIFALERITSSIGPVIVPREVVCRVEECGRVCHDMRGRAVHERTKHPEFTPGVES
jgi:hypothetical protein